MLYFKYLKMHLRALMEYRLSYWLVAVGQFLTSLFAFFSVVLLFQRFGAIDGWSFGEVALCFAVTGLAFALCETFCSGFDRFSRLVVEGTFDRILLRPRGTVLQVIGSAIDFTRVGRLLQNIMVLGIAIPISGVEWQADKIITLVLMIIGGTGVFGGIFILGAVVCFFTIDGLEVINIFTYGGRELASYPLPVYGKWLTRFFTFIIPFGCMNYLPLMYLTGRVDTHPLLYMLTPVLGLLFLLPCLLVWRLGVRHYRSTGS